MGDDSERRYLLRHLICNHEWFSRAAHPKYCPNCTRLISEGTLQHGKFKRLSDAEAKNLLGAPPAV